MKNNSPFGARAGQNLMLIGFLAGPLFLSGCSTGPKETPEQIALKSPETRDSVISQVKIGSPRSAVEKLLGRPTSEMITQSGAQATYTFGMDEMMEDMQPSTASSIGSSIVGSLGSLVGMAGPAGSVAAGVGSSVLSAATAPSMANPLAAMGKVETVDISYRNDQVVAISRSRGGMSGMRAMMGGMMGGGMMGSPMGGMIDPSMLQNGFPGGMEPVEGE